MLVFLRTKFFKILTGVYLLCFSHFTFAEFSIQDAKTRLVDKMYLLDAQFTYELTEKPIEALQNGVALTLVLTIVIERERQYLWDEEIVTLKHAYEFKYQILSKQYALKYLDTGIQETFPNLKSALSRISVLKDSPLLEEDLINDDNYWIYMQIYLDIESLPLPLRPLAYLSSDWRLTSEWYLCPLKTQ